MLLSVCVPRRAVNVGLAGWGACGAADACAGRGRAVHGGGCRATAVTRAKLALWTSAPSGPGIAVVQACTTSRPGQGGCAALRRDGAARAALWLEAQLARARPLDCIWLPQTCSSRDCPALGRRVRAAFGRRVRSASSSPGTPSTRPGSWHLRGRRGGSVPARAPRETLLSPAHACRAY